MIKCIIVEDDPGHRDRLINLLESVSVPIEILGTCQNVDDALKEINQGHPDLIFLDIELEGGETGFDLLRKVANIDFDVIFTTMHVDTDYAIAAIRSCALDFLPKPILKIELENSLKRYQDKNETGIEQVKTLLSNLESDNLDENKYIWIANQSIYTKVEISNIVYCNSENEGTYFHLDNPIEGRTKLYSTISIGKWEKHLEKSGILRIHNRYLVNIKHITNYIRGEGGWVRMKTGNELNVSRKRKEALLKQLGLK